MKKWLRRTLIAALIVGLTLAALYEAATHVGRGWLRGEAFYEGRPTSWWQGRIDDWMERQVSPDDAVESIDLRQQAGHWVNADRCNSGEFAILFSPRPLTPRSESWTRRFLNTWRSESEIVFDEHFPPGVLFRSTDAEAVLLELVQEMKYRAVAEQAIRNVRLLQSIKDAGKEPIFFLGMAG